MSDVDRYTLETPENIEVHFDIAGLGTRFCAMLLDMLLLAACSIALAILALMLESGFALSSRAAGGWVFAIIFAVLATLFSTGYFILFEWLMRGQTPGKHKMKIRVIRDDGTPVTIHEVLVRNILRLVDFLPGFYGVGVLVMFPSRLSKRLGDIAAGTIVIKEARLDYSANSDKKQAVHLATMNDANSELTVAERRLVDGFLQRRAELLPEARAALARRIAVPLHEKYGGELRDAEGYLLRLAKGIHHES